MIQQDHFLNSFQSQESRKNAAAATKGITAYLYEMYNFRVIDLFAPATFIHRFETIALIFLRASQCAVCRLRDTYRLLAQTPTLHRIASNTIVHLS